MALLDKIANKLENLSGEKGNNLGEVINKQMDNIFAALVSNDVRKIRVPDNVIAFIGASGGVGTSTIVANVAHSINKKGYSVIVLDMNLINPVQHILFGYKWKDIKNDVVDYLSGQCNLGSCILGNNRNGVQLISSGNRTIVDVINVDNQSKMISWETTIDRLKALYDVVLIDVNNMLMMDLVHASLYKADTIYTVWDENIECITSMERLKKNLDILGIRLGSNVIINKRTGVQYPNIFNKLGLELIDILPFDSGIIEASLMGKIFIDGGVEDTKNGSVFASKINDLSEKILNIGGAEMGVGKDDIDVHEDNKNNTEEKNEIEDSKDSSYDDDISFEE